MSQAFNKFQPYVANLSNGGLNQGTDTLKIFLSNTAPTNTHGTYSQESGTELANGNGYTTGGKAVTGVSSTQTAGTYTLSAANVVWTSVTGSMGPFRYAVLYDTVSGDLIGYWDYGSSVTLNGVNGDTFTIDLSGNILTLT
jgi:hypothetical protein